MADTLISVIKNVFDTTETNFYRIRFQVRTDRADLDTNGFKIARCSTTGTSPTYFFTGSIDSTQWYGVDLDVTVPQSNERSLLIKYEYVGFLVTGTDNMYIKNLKVEKMVKAEVQDTDISSRRNILYEGTKMSSTDINVDSPDTIDGGPVITVNTVGSSSPSSNPIGTSVIGPAVTMTQQQQTGQA